MILLWVWACSLSPGPAFPDPAADLLAELDADGSGALSAEELRARAPGKVLSMLDTDRDRQVSVEELRVHLDTPPEIGQPRGRGGGGPRPRSLNRR